ncbi:MAG: SLC13 family permease [Candidatus Jordarchaeales archaeon]|nr:anion transporter [Candidatus Jordarchaeia archaeon]
MHISISVIVLFAVFVLIAVRQIGRVRLKIWQIMLGGAVAVLLTQEISPVRALQAIDVDVMLFLFGMFVVGEALTRSGYLLNFSYRIFKKARSVDHLVLTVLFSMGLLSALLMNDTLAIIGTPLMMYFSKKHGLSPKLLLLSLAFAVTIGSVMSPIGNPQNLLIAIGGNMKNPFIDFFRHLTIPTFICFLAAYLLLKLFYRREFGKNINNQNQEPVSDEKLALLSKLSLMLIVAMIIVKILLVFVGSAVEFRLTYIALVAAAPILIFSKQRVEILKNIDWYTLIFFASMFVLMKSVWDSGFFQSFIGFNPSITFIPTILATSVIVSQFISNVPFVALYLPLLNYYNVLLSQIINVPYAYLFPQVMSLLGGTSTKQLVALAAGSTIAGNLTILGAASNVIIIQNAERDNQTLTFFEFAKVGAPLTIMCIITYWAFLTVM